MIKHTTYILLSILLISCSGDKSSKTPDDLEGKRALLSEKKKELKELEASITSLSKEINKLDPPKKKAAVQVKTMTLQPKEFKRFLDVQAQVMADDVVNASSEIGGRIVSLNVQEGDYVNRGQIIATTDMSTMETQIAEIQTSLSLAKTVYERQKRLWDQNIGSELKYLETKNNKERLEKSLETLRSQINKKNVYAPTSGIVEQEYLSQGETAGPGMPIVQIMNTSKVKVVADLQESLLGTIKKGEYVDVFFPALDKTLKLKVSMLGRSIDPANRTFKIEMSTSSQNGQLKPNLMAQVKLNDITQKDAIMIPIDAVQEDVGGNKFVFRVKEENGKQMAEKVLLELGESDGSEAIVLIGLNAGDVLITDGGMSIVENDLITTIPPSDGK